MDKGIGTLGIENHRRRERFDLYDLGLLTGPSLKGATIVVETVKELLKTTTAAFVVFDTVERLAVVRARAYPFRGQRSYPLYSSALAAIEEGEALITVRDLSKELPETAEATKMEMRSLIASAVHGPDERPIGALVALNASPRTWSEVDIQNLSNLAYLITQEVTLQASFATLQLMSVKEQPTS